MTKHPIPDADAMAPLPPPRNKRRFEPMLMADVEHWVSSYNAWVDVWNKRERSRDLELSPAWPDAMFIGGDVPRSALLFEVRATGRQAMMRFRGYWHFEGGWSFCRCPASVGNLIWAGWMVRK